MADESSFRLDTLAVHGGAPPEARALGPVEAPLVLSSAFTFASGEQAEAAFSGEAPAWIYGRWGNPTVAELEHAMATLECGKAAVATASGMAAVSGVVVSLCGAGDHVVAPRSLYGETARLFRERAPRLGIRTTFVDGSDPEAFAAAIGDNTRIVYLESPQNPTLGILDLKAISALATARGVLVVVDNTFATPVCQRPLTLGADLVLHSMTKALSGHGDVIGGVVVAKTDALRDRVADTVVKGFGGVLSPFSAFLTSRGLRTLHLRVARACESAARLAEALEEHPHVSAVHYPGLASHPSHAIARAQMSSFGGMLSFDLGDKARARSFVERVRVMTHAVSLGDVRTLVTHPATTTASTMPLEDRRAVGITDGLVRVSVGVEHVDDLLDDLRGALA